MNKERILHLAEKIRGVPHYQPSYDDWYNDRQYEMAGFNMQHLHCGTVGCIAGWARFLWGETERTGAGRLVEHLGLPEGVAQILFIPNLPGVSLSQVEPEQAARALDLVADRDPKTSMDMMAIWREVLDRE